MLTYNPRAPFFLSADRISWGSFRPPAIFLPRLLLKPDAREAGFWTEKTSLGPKLPLPVCFRKGIRELNKKKAGSLCWPLSGQERDLTARQSVHGQKATPGAQTAGDEGYFRVLPGRSVVRAFKGPQNYSSLPGGREAGKPLPRLSSNPGGRRARARRAGCAPAARRGRRRLRLPAPARRAALTRGGRCRSRVQESGRAEPGQVANDLRGPGRGALGALAENAAARRPSFRRRGACGPLRPRPLTLATESRAKSLKEQN